MGWTGVLLIFGSLIFCVAGTAVFDNVVGDDYTPATFGITLFVLVLCIVSSIYAMENLPFANDCGKLQDESMGTNWEISMSRCMKVVKILYDEGGEFTGQDIIDVDAQTILKKDSMLNKVFMP